MAAKSKGINFEKSLSELERLVQKLEEGELSLEDSLKTYERGVVLSRSCQQALTDAEQRVRMLADKHGDPTTESFEFDDGEDGQDHDE